ncbi:hypothetical protein [Streptomyces sp. TLI_171]|uniref:hypothetical protein n=1 Tax=Streptomyces sp. TLI_171 TaxID=1938859 RepID=UPI000C18CBF9|nr:hypothetical protein [Streptomyces sp. TLI_171]RKE18576.1 hypothetical protein BX266_1869 [Streptomyces sp. TLI_171]
MNRSSVRPARRTVRTAAALAAAALIAAGATACNDDDPAPAATASHPAGAPAAAASAAASSGTQGARTVQVGRTAWWGGLKFEVKSATYTPGANGDYQVVLDTAVTNTFRTTAVNYWPDLAIDLGGTPVTGDQGTAVPPVPGATNPLPITFRGVTDKSHPFAFDGASFVLGAPGTAQAVVPLGKGGRAAVSLKPVDLKLSGTSITSGRLTLDLKSAQVRADFGDGNGVTTLKPGQRAVLVLFDMKGAVGPAGMAVDGSVLRLKLPNGQEVGPTVAPIEAIYPDRPLRQDQAAWFVFSGATDGDYTFSVTDAPNAAAPVKLTGTGLADSGPLS